MFKNGIRLLKIATEVTTRQCHCWNVYGKVTFAKSWLAQGNNCCTSFANAEVVAETAETGLSVLFTVDIFCRKSEETEF
jgi:hypothetical protein